MIIRYSNREYAFPESTTVQSILGQIDKGLCATTACVKIGNGTYALTDTVTHDCEIEIVSKNSREGLSLLRHSAAHLLAEAVKTLCPQAKLAIGPATDEGFYYDFDAPVPFTPEFLRELEKEMAKIIRRNPKFVYHAISRENALLLMKDEPYKRMLIQELPENEEISFYSQGAFTDLCKGPHLPNAALIKGFRLLSVAGAYWRGSEKNKMLQRIYGTAFYEKSELDEYLFRLEEAKKRDHRKLGRALDLFDVFEEGPGFPFFFPKGMVLRNLLESYWREIHLKNGYQEIRTPMMLTRSLWETSGHWEHYRDSMYTSSIDDTDYAIKPMNCPGGMLVYKRKPVSYKELPLRCGELGLVHRNEKSGTLHGLMRVRCFTQDDAHIFMTEAQIQEEIKGVFRLIDEVYSVFGFEYTVELSTRPVNSIGTDEMWEIATNGLQGALDSMNVPYTVNEGDGAFYGPKIDFHLKDSIGRTWQCGTIQLDMNLPERFRLEYTGKDGEKHRPIMIHRVVFGSIERFLAILTEHFCGAFPLWLSPVQVKILTVTNRADDHARSVLSVLSQNGIRAEADLENEKIGAKIRRARLEKTPYLIILGDRDVCENTLSVKKRGAEQTESLSLPEFLSRLQEEIRLKSKSF